jgi:hypothetical protein
MGVIRIRAPFPRQRPAHGQRDGDRKPERAAEPTWTIPQHVAWEDPGLIAAEIRARAGAVDLRRLDLGDTMPAVQDVAGPIVMGGAGTRAASRS